MKYVVIDERKYDEFTKEFNDKDEALAEAQYQWDHMTEKEQKDTVSFIVLESVNPDEEAENHFDGDVVKAWEYQDIRFYVADDDGTVYGHDLTYEKALNCCEVARKENPEAPNIEVLNDEE